MQNLRQFNFIMKHFIKIAKILKKTGEELKKVVHSEHLNGNQIKK